MIPLLAAALAVILVVPVLIVVWSRWSWSLVSKRRVLVQTDADVSFEGVLVQRRGPLLHLADVTVRTSVSAKADGLVVVERSRVLWIQVTA